MDFLNSSSYIFIIIAVGILAIVGYAIYSKKKHRTQEAETQVEGEVYLHCRIADETTGMIGDDIITKTEADGIIQRYGTLGRKRLRDNKWIYGFYRHFTENKELVLEPIDNYLRLHDAEIDRDPRSFYYETKRYALGYMMLKLSKDKGDVGFLEKNKSLIVLLGAMLLIAFMWGVS